MNENFNFLASEIKEKDVYCDNGETISDAINDGYNSLTIHGDCSGAIGVYKLAPSAYGISYNDMPNKPISYLIIKGYNDDKSDTITTPSGGFDFFVDDSYLQISGITLNLGEDFYFGSSFLRSKNCEINGKLKLSRSSSGDIEDTIINGEVNVRESSSLPLSDSTINGEIEIEHNSSIKIWNSTINGELDIVDNSHASLDESTINGTVNNRTVKVKNNSSLSAWKSDITGFTGAGDVIWVYNNSSVEFNGDPSDTNGQTNIIAPTGEHAIRLELNSSGQISTTNITSVDKTAVYMQHNSSLQVWSNVTIDRTNDTSSGDIRVSAPGELSLNDSTITVGNVDCEDIISKVDLEQSLSASLGSKCNGYQNLIPNYREIYSGTCESSGFNNLISAHECSQAGSQLANTIDEDGFVPKGCIVSGGKLFININDNSVTQVGTNAQSAWCKE
ncbi:MAG: hypothetical protein CL925_03320 [Deltaproteobacteria bacterium]|jgi:hypothetical protein|nr:hypothetical protein [Deltaproteobacteria bacterium]